MKKNMILVFVLLIALFSLPTFTPVSISAETTSAGMIKQGSGCPYVCREEYKLCVKRKGSNCRTKLNRCLRMCPK